MFSIEKKIYYHDTDAGGVVYYASYLKHLEEGRSEFCMSKGVNFIEYASHGIIFPVVHLEVDYKSPARYGDTVKIFTEITDLGKCSIHYAQQIERDGKVLLSADIVTACVDKAMKPRAIPEEIKKALS